MITETCVGSADWHLNVRLERYRPHARLEVEHTLQGMTVRTRQVIELMAM